MKLSDFKGIFKKSIARVESVRNVYGDYYEIKLIPENNISWQAGEHGIFRLMDRNVKGKSFRAFSLASTSDEKIIILGTRTGKEISSFKSELISMQKGERILINGPFGWFKIQDDISPIVMIAGGVGITPIRALLKRLEEDESRPVELIYSSSEYYLFDDDIHKIISSNSKIALHKTSSRKETEDIIDELAIKYMNSAYYYISGARPFIKGVKNQLINKNIKKNRVINDPFFGY